MSKFPSGYDSDVELPPVNDDITEVGGEAINALREAVFNIEQEIGLGASGTTGSISARLGISLDLDGKIKPSAIASMGLVTLPIFNSHISSTAEIIESKLKLDHRTQDLFNYIQDLSGDVNSALGWISITGSKLEPHIAGAAFRHELRHIDVDFDSNNYFKNRFGLLRNNTNSYYLFNDINNDYIAHQKSDGIPTLGAGTVVTTNGFNYPGYYAHHSRGIYLDASQFLYFPQTLHDVQQFADFLDSSGIFLLGTRIQNLYANGISRTSRSSTLNLDGYGQSIVPVTNVYTHLLSGGFVLNPFDDIDTGDDIITFLPAAPLLANNSFDAQFSQVKIGDIIRVNYGTVEVSFLVKEKKYLQVGLIKTFLVRIDGKNLLDSVKAGVVAQARIDRPLLNINKYAVLATASANNQFNEMPSLIIGNARGAVALGLGFNPDLFDEEHYMLYLGLCPNGLPQDSYILMPGIDVTGNKGATPGNYTLETIVQSTNDAFRKNGYNYRFTAFTYGGEFGIMLASSHSNVAFNINGFIVDTAGALDKAASNLAFPKNVIDVFATSPSRNIDPLGFSFSGSNVASTVYKSSYTSAEEAHYPTKLFIPLKRNNYYVDGVEREKLANDVFQTIDQYGDGYWFGTIVNRTQIAGAAGRVEVTYRVALDLSTSKLKAGKTLIVQSAGQGTYLDFGRFLIKNVSFNACPADYTDITLYDAVHANGISPISGTLQIGAIAELYFSADSVSFNKETATDDSAIRPFKRHFEVYTDKHGETFTHERGRFINSGSNLVTNSVALYASSDIKPVDIIKISTKLRGYQFGVVNKIALKINNFNLSVDGIIDGYLANWDGINLTRRGPLTFGRMGEVIRFYDETHIDYIDFVFPESMALTAFSNAIMDIQLFPTLSLDDEIMLISTCEVDDVTNKVLCIRDERQFGNTSEKHLTTSALDYIALGERILHANGVVRGLDIEATDSNPNPNDNQIYLTGGMAVVNGKFVQMDSQTIAIPAVYQVYSAINYAVTWALCVNDKGEYQTIPLLDIDNTTATPASENRPVSLLNPFNSQTYFVDARTFRDIVNVRKDLTPLYLVTNTLTVTPIPLFGGVTVDSSLSIKNVRKYVGDLENNVPYIFTNDNQGNFKDFRAMLEWMKLNSLNNGTAITRGMDFTFDQTNETADFIFPKATTIDGQGFCTITVNEFAKTKFGPHVTFKNLNMIINGPIESAISPLTGIVDVTGIKFENCNITININAAPVAGKVIDWIGNDIEIDNCNFFINFNIIVSDGTIFAINNFSSVNVKNKCTIKNSNFSITNPNTRAPSDVFQFDSCSNLTIDNCIIQGVFRQAIDLVNCNNFTFTNSFVYGTWECSSYGGYATSNRVNSGIGYLHMYVNTSYGLTSASTTTTFSNVTINNVKFEYRPSIVSTERFGFINFVIPKLSTLNNLEITNCSFYSGNSSAPDYRAAISVISPLTTPVSAPSFQSVLNNANISNNFCNKDQMIILSKERDVPGSLGHMSFPGIELRNCLIQNNVCGTIGFWGSAGIAYDTIASSASSFNNKRSNLIISNNTCHYIGTLDSFGIFFLAYDPGTLESFSSYASVNVLIQGNNANWIQVTAILATEGSRINDESIKILDNTLTTYHTTYLTPLGAALPGNIVVITDSALMGAQPNVLISNNRVGGGNYYNGGVITLITTLNYLSITTSAIVTNNVFDGIAVGGNAIELNCVYIIFTGNVILRGTNGISNYIIGPGDPETTYGIITDNIFDQPTRNGSVEVTLANLPYKWIKERNINQTVYKYIPILEGSVGLETIAIAGIGGSLGPDAPAASGAFIDATGINASPVSYYIDTSDPIVTRSLAWRANLDQHLPENVKVIQIKMGMKRVGANLMTAGSTMALGLFRSDPTKISTDQYTNLDTPNFGVAYPFTDAYIDTPNNLVATQTGPSFNAGLTTIYFDVPVTNTDVFVTGRTVLIQAHFSMIFERFSGTTLQFLLSPLMVKFRW